MIKFEHGMLVLDSSATLEDMRAVTEFQDYVRNREQERILKLLEETADVYLADKLLVESAIILNAVAFIRGDNNEVS